MSEWVTFSRRSSLFSTASPPHSDNWKSSFSVWHTCQCSTLDCRVSPILLLVHMIHPKQLIFHQSSHCYSQKVSTSLHSIEYFTSSCQPTGLPSRTLDCLLGFHFLIGFSVSVYFTLFFSFWPCAVDWAGYLSVFECAHWIFSWLTDWVFAVFSVYCSCMVWRAAWCTLVGVYCSCMVWRAAWCTLVGVVL